MLRSGTGAVPQSLLFPGSEFQSTPWSLPASEVSTLTDGAFGETDQTTQFVGGVATSLMVRSTHNENSTGLFLYLGACHIIRKDLWDFAVMLRPGNGTFTWPKYETVFMCPVCANIATPDDTKTKQWILTSQYLTQMGEGHSAGRIGVRLMARLFCHACFPTDRVDARTGVASILGLAGTNSAYDSAYELAALFEDSGMSGVASRRMMEQLGTAMKGSNGKLKARISKSLTKENRGQAIVTFGKTTCNYCQKTKKEIVGEVDDATGELKKMNKCSACRFVTYCR